MDKCENDRLNGNILRMKDWDTSGLRESLKPVALAHYLLSLTYNMLHIPPTFGCKKTFSVVSFMWLTKLPPSWDYKSIPQKRSSMIRMHITSVIILFSCFKKVCFD